MVKKLNFNIGGGLRIDKETFDLINKISNDLGVRNTDIVRILLRTKCEEITNEGVENFSLVISGRKKKMKGEKEND
tara:strand:- start:902 stop:1129 length:228 start_codon:yes stop_codon:yes gene_type:complete